MHTKPTRGRPGKPRPKTRGIDDAITAARSQERLAQQLGVTQQSICKWAARGYVPIARAREIEAVFGVPRKSLVSPKVLDILAEVWGDQ